MDYNFKEIEKSGRINGIRKIPLPQKTTLRFRSSTPWWNFPILPVRACTWDIPEATPP